MIRESKSEAGIPGVWLKGDFPVLGVQRRPLSFFLIGTALLMVTPTG